MATEATSSSQFSRINNRSDPGWKYCHSLTEGDTYNIVCNFCEKVTRGGITRAKNHLTGSSNNVKACPKCPKEVQEELKQYAKDKKKQNNFEIPNVRELDLENTGFGESEDELDNYRDFLPPSSATGKKNVAEKGPMDLFCRKPETAIEKRKKEKLRQTIIREACDKEAKASFQEMVTAIGSYGPHLPVPSYHDIRVPLLNKELEYTESGEMDGNDEDVGNELVFDDDETLNCATVYEASGVGEPRTYTRQRSRKRKEPASVATIAKTSKKGVGASSKGKSQVVVEDDEPEFEDNFEETEEEVNFDQSEGEEEEGYASIEDKEIDCVGLEEEN
ncbi:Zinc finger, BED-type [Sesbania bispinosa]|nr:Zinc finger, BED-type [Sesbania bispinosa]